VALRGDPVPYCGGMDSISAGFISPRHPAPWPEGLAVLAVGRRVAPCPPATPPATRYSSRSSRSPRTLLRLENLPRLPPPHPPRYLVAGPVRYPPATAPATPCYLSRLQVLGPLQPAPPLGLRHVDQTGAQPLAMRAVL
jgi:hypothetical protein